MYTRKTETKSIRTSSKLYFMLALFLFLMPFFFYLPQLFSETTNTITLFGYDLHHNYINNQHFVWSISIKIISITYIFLWFMINNIRKSGLYVYITLMPFIYLVLRANSNSISPLEDKYVSIFSFILLLFVGLLRVKNKKIKLAFSKEDSTIDVFFPLAILFFSLLFVISYNKVFEHYAALFISDFGFNTTTDFLWYLSLKMLVICPLFYWFLTEKRWFRYALLSPIVIFSMQLFNAITNNEMPIDEIEIFQTLHFTVPLFIILIFLAKAFDNQEKIQAWINAQYILLEHSIKQKFHQKEGIIKNAREQLKNKDLGLKGLEALKTRLEKEVNS